MGIARWLELAEKAQFRSSQLARLLNRSSRQLNRYFHEDFGCSAQCWLDEQRLLHACHLLQEQPVKLVAFTVGFKQVSHFSRAFKNRYGMSPRKFAQNGTNRCST